MWECTYTILRLWEWVAHDNKCRVEVNLEKYPYDVRKDFIQKLRLADIASLPIRRLVVFTEAYCRHQIAHGLAVVRVSMTNDISPLRIQVDCSADIISAMSSQRDAWPSGSSSVSLRHSSLCSSRRTIRLIGRKAMLANLSFWIKSFVTSHGYFSRKTLTNYMCQPSECNKRQSPKTVRSRRKFALGNGWIRFFHLVLRCCQFSPFHQGNLYGIVLYMPAQAGRRCFSGQLRSHRSTFLSDTQVQTKNI